MSHSPPPPSHTLSGGPSQGHSLGTPLPYEPRNEMKASFLFGEISSGAMRPSPRKANSRCQSRARAQQSPCGPHEAHQPSAEAFQVPGHSKPLSPPNSSMNSVPLLPPFQIQKLEATEVTCGRVRTCTRAGRLQCSRSPAPACCLPNGFHTSQGHRQTD